jgi:hypothetical protein
MRILTSFSLLSKGAVSATALGSAWLLSLTFLAPSGFQPVSTDVAQTLWGTNCSPVKGGKICSSTCGYTSDPFKFNSLGTGSYSPGATPASCGTTYCTVAVGGFICGG